MRVFQHLEPYAGDPILSLNEAFHADPRPHKVNLSIGIYFDDDGRIPVLGCVHAAEAQLLRLLLVDEQLMVTDFRRREYDLEDVFIKIVEDQDHDSR